MGINSCNGQSSCKTANNQCKGMNSCKSQGFLELTQKECDAAKAKAAKEKKNRPIVRAPNGRVGGAGG